MRYYDKYLYGYGESIMASRLTRHSDSNWLANHWRPIAALVYLFICLFDFVMAPAWVGMHTETISELVMAIKDLPVQTQIILAAPRSNEWNPLTLIGGGLFHVAFGAILGASAWSHGREKVEEMRQDGETQRANISASPPNPPLPSLPTMTTMTTMTTMPTKPDNPDEK